MSAGSPAQSQNASRPRATSVEVVEIVTVTPKPRLVPLNLPFAANRNALGEYDGLPANVLLETWDVIKTLTTFEPLQG